MRIEKDILKVQYINDEFPKILLDENNIIPNYGNINNYYYPLDFELIERETLKKLCNHLKINISSNILDKICFKALLGDEKLYLQRETKDLKEIPFIIYTRI